MLLDPAPLVIENEGALRPLSLFPTRAQASFLFNSPIMCVHLFLVFTYSQIFPHTPWEISGAQRMSPPPHFRL